MSLGAACSVTSTCSCRPADEQLGFSHPENAGWDHFSFCQFTAPLRRLCEFVMPNPVVVFGGTGFLGRAIVNKLLAHGWPVRVAARGVAAHAFDAEVERCTVDIRDEDGVAEAMAGASAAVNAVSLYVEDEVGDFATIHIHAAERIARIAAAAGVERLVHISGLGVDTASPSPYVRARAHGEKAVHSALPAARILRPSVIFGPGDHFLATLDRVTRLPVIPLFGRGQTRLQPVHVDDVALAVTAVLTDETTAGVVFEFGGAEVLAYRDILHKLLRHRGRRRVLMPVPMPIWYTLARACAVLPTPPVTVDQLALMSADNVTSTGAATFEDLNIAPRALTDALSTDGQSRDK